MNYEKLGLVTFPEVTREHIINMMPIVFGDWGTLPANLLNYLPMIESAEFSSGEIAYLTIHESWVEAGQTQRRPGIHTDGATFSWGGGGWGGGTPPKPAEPKPAGPKKGIYMSSSDGRCRVWDDYTRDVDRGGGLRSAPNSASEIMDPSRMYWMTDRTPHESLPALQSGFRSFFRLVSGDVGAWWSKHSTPNPLGVQPNCHVIHTSKFGES